MKFDRRFDTPSPVSGTNSYGNRGEDLNIMPLVVEKRGGGYFTDAVVVGLTLAIVVMLVIILFWLINFTKTLSAGESFTVKNEHSPIMRAEVPLSGAN